MIFSQSSFPAAILGIDAAWTERQPSGVALIQVERGSQPRLIALGRSYEEFCAAGKFEAPDWRTLVHGSRPRLEALLSQCNKLSGVLPRIIALDIPLSRRLIMGRRACDNAVTSAYVSRGAGTHTPSAERPGRISKLLYDQLCALGYHLRTAGATPPFSRLQSYFIETYPHPVIIELLHLKKRLPYKSSKTLRYWPELSLPARRQKLCKQLEALRHALGQKISGVGSLIPPAATLLHEGSFSRLKGLEDALDAIVCAWSGYQFFLGNAVAYGDDDATIWVPAPRR